MGRPCPATIALYLLEVEDPVPAPGFHHSSLLICKDPRQGKRRIRVTLRVSGLKGKGEEETVGNHCRKLVSHPSGLSWLPTQFPILFSFQLSGLRWSRKRKNVLNPQGSYHTPPASATHRHYHLLPRPAEPSTSAGKGIPGTETFDVQPPHLGEGSGWLSQAELHQPCPEGMAEEGWGRMKGGGEGRAFSQHPGLCFSSFNCSVNHLNKLFTNHPAA